MYNYRVIDALVKFIESKKGIGDKRKLAAEVKTKFGLTSARSVLFSTDFAIRFSKSDGKRFSSTVLALSTLKKYDDRPFFVCAVSGLENRLYMANTTFLKKISHSSKELSEENICGSFNGPDIIMNYKGLENEPKNFSGLYAYHSKLLFDGNIERLVRNTNGIVGRVHKFEVTEGNRRTIYDSVARTIKFVGSREYLDLKEDLHKRVESVREEILKAAAIDNVNVRGRVIEFLITAMDSPLKRKLTAALMNGTNLPEIKTEDGLGDYSKTYHEFVTETDIKSKVVTLESNPKAYNVDKLLEFLSHEKSVYLIYLLGINGDGDIIERLVPAFDSRLIKETKIIHHLAGRDSRGAAQFMGNALVSVLEQEDVPHITRKEAEEFLGELIKAGEEG